MRFFEQLLPEAGLICVAKPYASGKGFQHWFYTDLESAIRFAHHMDAAGNTMYLAQASFSTTAEENRQHNLALPPNLSVEERKAQRLPERSQANVEMVRSFWFDIDCGPEKYAEDPDNSYPTQVDGLRAIREFSTNTGLPRPTLVNSGNGLYAHWFLDRDVPANVWTVTAQLLKSVAKAWGMKADPSRTADCASVLRPIGTTNRKRGESKEVKLIDGITDPLDFDKFQSQLLQLAKEKKLDTQGFTAPKNLDINAEFLTGLEGAPKSAFLIASKCGQMEHIERTQGNVSEPLWYAALGILKFTKESPQIAHDWSCGHPSYDPAVTEAKLEQWNAGPTTCFRFGELNASFCLGCKHKDKIKSPISLGVPEPERVHHADPEADIEAPDSFTRAADGLYYTEDGVSTKFYHTDLYPIAVAYDHSLGYETARFRHKLPFDGWKEFTFRSSTVIDPKQMLIVLADNHISVSGQKEKKLMVHYVESFLDRLKKTQSMAQLHTQMGWHVADGEHQFVLGSRVLTPKGGSMQAGLAHSIPGIAQAITPIGSVSEWARATSILNTRGMEPLAFALMAGAFGAPLMKFTGFDGALLSLVGKSGSGKTTAAFWALSAYGDPRKLFLRAADTQNFLVGRLGLYGNLPLYVDEVTNIDAMALSDLVYCVTQGRDKGRLTKNAIERPNINTWATVALTSSNASLIDKLGHAKSDASAEINRVFEYRVEQHPALTKDAAAFIHRTMENNYGCVGDAYVRYLVDHATEHGKQLDSLTAKIDAMIEAKPEERFWSALAAATMYGGFVAKKLGLIQFELAPVLTWLSGTVKSMRAVKGDYAADSVSLLGQFLDRHASGIILVGDSGKKMASLLKEPHGSIVARLETDTMKLFISRDVLRRELYKTYGSYDIMKFELSRDGALAKHDVRKNLGAGTYLSGVQQTCWMLDLNASCLGHVASSLLSVVQGGKTEAR